MINSVSNIIYTFVSSLKEERNGAQLLLVPTLIEENRKVCGKGNTSYIKLHPQYVLFIFKLGISVILIKNRSKQFATILSFLLIASY